MGIVARTAVVLVAAFGAGSAADAAAPIVRMLTPTHIAPQRFVTLRVKGGARGTLRVNGTRVGVGDLGTTAGVRFRPRFGWEPGRLYRIRLRATDRGGNARTFKRAIRARNFRIVTLAVRNLTRTRPTSARAA